MNLSSIVLLVSILLHVSLSAEPAADNCALLFKAIKEQSYLDIAEALTFKGINSNCKDKHGNTAVHYFAHYREDCRILALLVFRAGHRLDQANDTGETPLAMAYRINNQKALRAIISFSTPINPVTIPAHIQKSFSSTPAHHRTCRLLGK